MSKMVSSDFFLDLKPLKFDSKIVNSESLWFFEPLPLYLFFGFFIFVFFGIFLFYCVFWQWCDIWCHTTIFSFFSASSFWAGSSVENPAQNACMCNSLWCIESAPQILVLSPRRPLSLLSWSFRCGRMSEPARTISESEARWATFAVSIFTPFLHSFIVMLPTGMRVFFFMV